jgi:hypothetical protein
MAHPAHHQVLALIERLEQFINEWEMIPATGALRNRVILALLSKSLTVGKAICTLIKTDFPAEAFGMSRVLIDIFFSVRYISTNNTEQRARTFADYGQKVRKEFAELANKYLPHRHIDIAAVLGSEAMKTAEGFKTRHQWTGHGGGAKFMAMEPDAYETDEHGVPITSALDYDLFYFWASHFVHVTVKALGAHGISPGDIYRVHPCPLQDDSYGRLSLFNTLIFLDKIFIYACRAMHEEQPGEILEEMLSLSQTL